MDFETVAAEPPVAPTDTKSLERAMVAVPLVELWCRAVRHEVDRLVREGKEVIGTDGKPYKIVEGKLGDRAWTDEDAAKAALLGQLPPEKVFKPQEIITASVASKILDKKKTKAIWTDIFVPLIKRAPGQPVLALGSDPRPPYSGAAGEGDFDEIPAE